MKKITEKIEVYTQKGCKNCEDIIQELKNNEISFQQKETNNYREEFDEIVRLTRFAQTPVLHYKNNYFMAGRDFNSPKNIIQVLENYQECKHSLERQNNEAIRTLTYNIMMAFQRTDNLLRKIETKLTVSETVVASYETKQAENNNKNKQ